jgi:uncharacterized membrane protein YhaH (DUF805 family)
MKLFNGRLNPKNYIIGVIIFWILGFVAAAPSWIILYAQHLDKLRTLSEVELTKFVASQFSIFSVGGVIFYTLTSVVIFLSLGISVRRLHDLGKSGALAGLIILDFFTKRIFAEWILFSGFKADISATWILQIPNLVSVVTGIFVIYLIIKKGEERANQYGEIPTNKTTLKNILLAK